MARRRRGRSGIKTASKAEERELLAAVDALAEDPTRLLPECIHDDADRCHLRKIERKLEKVHGKRGDTKKLKRASGGWTEHNLSKALADSFILADEGKAPYLGRVRFGSREVPYAKRGDAPKEVLACVQHHEDPQLRVFPLRKDIEKKDLHIYSCEAGWWCTGTEPDPPEAFVEEALAGLAAVSARGEDDGGRTVHTCPHVSPDRVGEDGPPHLVIAWRTAGRRVAVCEDCTAEGGNTALALMGGIAAAEPAEGFDVAVHLPPPTCRGHEGACPAAGAYEAAFDAGGYLDGDLTDRQLLARARDQVRDRLGGRERFLVARDVCHGDDAEAFLDALHASDLERMALTPVLADHAGPVVTGQSTANKLLAELWDDHADALVEAVSDADVAADVLEAYDPRNTPPSEILRTARRRWEAAHMEARLPTYATLPRPVRVADTVARTDRLEGHGPAVRACDPDRGWGHRAKGVAYGFLLALDEASGEEWKFSQEEREVGEFLADRARALLEAEPDAYHDALVAVAKAAGVTEGFSPDEDEPGGDG